MTNLKPTIQEMLDGMRKFESRNESRQTSQHNKEVQSAGEIIPAEEIKAAEEIRAAEETRPTIADAISTIKAYHVTMMTGLQSRHEETMKALEAHHAQLIDTLEYNLVLVSYLNDADKTGCRQMHLATLPGPSRQTPDQSGRTSTSETKSPKMKEGVEPPSVKHIDAGASRSPKEERVGPSSAENIQW